MKATIWHNPNCGTSRNTLAILKSQDGVDVTVIEYVKTGFNRNQLADLIKDAGHSPKSILRVQGTPAEELGLTQDGVSDDMILDAMMDNPILVQRPIVQTDKGTRLCRPKEMVMEII